MSGGGGKSGKETTEKTIPDWIKDPAVRNMQRAEDVQRIEYMPYRGAEVAAFNETQNAAMNNNIGAAEAFGLLGANHGLTAETGMPTATTFDGGYKGYSSMPLYDQALAETKAAQPGAVAQYDALFGAPAMAQLNAARNSGRGGGGGITPRGGAPAFTPNYDTSTWSTDEQRRHNEEITATGDGSSTSTLDASYGLTKDGLIGGNKGSGTNYKAIVAQNKQDAMKNAMSSYLPRTGGKR